MRKTAKTLFAAGTLTALFAFPALANFSWQVDNMDTDYVGTATVTLKDLGRKYVPGNGSGRKKRRGCDLYGTGRQLGILCFRL